MIPITMPIPTSTNSIFCKYYDIKSNSNKNYENYNFRSKLEASKFWRTKKNMNVIISINKIKRIKEKKGNKFIKYNHISFLWLNVH